MSLGLAACLDDGNPSAVELADVVPDLELIDERQIMDAHRVNVSVRGTFQVVAGTPSRVLGAGGREEKANFPGHPPAGPGTCLDGRWYNARGQETSGSVDHAHPHCFDPGSGGMTIVLEPISSEFIRSFARATLVLSNLNDLYVHHEANPTLCPEREVCFQQGGWGTVAAHAIDAATGRRVGFLSLPLTVDPRVDAFTCTLDGDPAQTGCINYIYTAFYKPAPIEQGGQGDPQFVSGFLYWSVAG